MPLKLVQDRVCQIRSDQKRWTTAARRDTAPEESFELHVKHHIGHDLSQNETSASESTHRVREEGCIGSDRQQSTHNPRPTHEPCQCLSKDLTALKAIRSKSSSAQYIRIIRAWTQTSRATSR